MVYQDTAMIVCNSCLQAGFSFFLPIGKKVDGSTEVCSHCYSADISTYLSAEAAHAAAKLKQSKQQPGK